MRIFESSKRFLPRMDHYPAICQSREMINSPWLNLRIRKGIPHEVTQGSHAPETHGGKQGCAKRLPGDVGNLRSGVEFLQRPFRPRADGE
jgi:hypothetical protein